MKIFGYDTENAFDYENGFYLTSAQHRMQKMIAHYEIYKKIIGLPGQVIELGVFKGCSLLRLASFRNMLESSSSRLIIGFDAFGDFPYPENASDSDANFIQNFEKIAGKGISEKELMQALQNKKIDNVELVAGDILQTLPLYLDAKPQTKVALLHIDVDVYYPSKVALDLLYPALVPGGIIVLDDYGTVEGETRAVDEFVEIHGLSIQKLPFSYIPAFIEKPIVKK